MDRRDALPCQSVVHIRFIDSRNVVNQPHVVDKRHFPPLRGGYFPSWFSTSQQADYANFGVGMTHRDVAADSALRNMLLRLRSTKGKTFFKSPLQQPKELSRQHSARLNTMIESADKQTDEG